MSKSVSTILGLDIGLASVGWSLIETHADIPTKIIQAGVRVFPMGMELDDRGKGTSRSVERREARLRRRQLDRRAMRKAHIRKLLFVNNLAPDRKVDAQAWRAFEGLQPYELRAKGLDQPLTAHEFGRVIYHIAQRRGFLSNRKAPEREDDKPGEVKQATQALETEMKAAGCRTLGEFFSKLDPHQQRIRKNYTLRRWYIEEFDALWAVQTKAAPDRFHEALGKQLRQALFYQRPLKIKEGSVGTCELEAGKKRSRIALLDAQRFRLLQQVNNLRLETGPGKERALTPEERTKIMEMLATKASVKFGTIRKALKIRGDFNLERGGSEALIGDATTAIITAKIGSAWDELDRAERDQLVNDMLSIDHAEVLKRRLMTRWALDEAAADALSEVALEDGHSALSVAAINKLLPHMEAGDPYMTAVMKAYPDNANWKPADEVPPFPNLRNPLVQRSLAETRRVVNAIVQRHGKPGRIRVELARDLKKAAKERESEWSRMRVREKERAEAREALQRLKEYHIANPKASDIEKWLLFKECGGMCPYTGKAITHAGLFGEHPQFDVEHIIPFSRSLDDSFGNKTLCCVDYNRNIKKNKTPYETSGSTPQWEEIIARVKKFNGVYAEAKLRRFVLENVAEGGAFLENFSQRDLAITRYATKAAYQALSRLYAPGEAKSRVEATQGVATSYLRRAWRLNNVLGLANEKTRDDHRQHAIDATVVALTNRSTIKALADAAVMGRAGAFTPIPEPWEGFKEDLASTIQGIVTSHRVSKKTNGPLHKETYYGIITDPSDLKTNRAVVRKDVASLSDKDVAGEVIVDPAVRDAVRARLSELGESDPKKAFKDRAQHPYLTAKDGRKIPIHKVRAFQKCDPLALETAPGSRHVVLGNNHHVEFFLVKDNKGNPTLKSAVISQLDVRRLVAKARKDNVAPVIVRKADEEGNPLAFSLAIGEFIEFEWQGKRSIFVVQKLSFNDYNFRNPEDARKVKDLPKQDVIRIRSDNSFFMLNPQKLVCDPLGHTYRTRD